MGRRGPEFIPGGGGGARPNGAGTGSFPVPTTVDGRFGDSCEFVLGRRGTSNDIVEEGRSAAAISICIR